MIDDARLTHGSAYLCDLCHPWESVFPLLLFDAA